MRSTRYVPVLLLLLLMCIWGYSWVPSKLGVTNSSPFVFAALRSLPAALLLLSLLPLTGRPLRPKGARLTAAVGVCQVGGFTGLTCAALFAGGAGHTAMLANTWQFWLLVLAWWFLGDRLIGLQWIAVALALTGLVLIIEPWGLRGVLSSLLTLAAAVLFAAGAIFAKLLRQRHTVDLLSFTAWQSLFGSLPLIILALAIPGDPIRWNADFVWSWAFSTLVASAFSGLLWLYILGTLPANVAGIGTVGTPVVGVLASYLQLGEQLSGYEISGMVLVVTALGLLVLHGSGVLSRMTAVISTRSSAETTSAAVPSSLAVPSSSAETSSSAVPPPEDPSPGMRPLDFLPQGGRRGD
jgi:drug/metabolite transporter (DMT)-like permease